MNYLIEDKASFLLKPCSLTHDWQQVSWLQQEDSQYVTNFHTFASSQQHFKANTYLFCRI